MEHIIRTRFIYTAGLFLSLALAFSSCATKHRFTTSPVVPAAEGSVKVKKDNNSNYSIGLKVKRLADSKRLSPPRDMYIVWMETADNGIKNIGRLNTSSGFLSKTLKSSLNTVSTFRPTGFFITGENEAGLAYPSGFVVLRTDSF
ncbi:MAG: hypothetical protein EOO04_37670 [Chitinophagaceae bacterium]|nr:MAG: hypothetical protein EOO04_37670 [Chitinophagaceae bacterium]